MMHTAFAIAMASLGVAASAPFPWWHTKSSFDDSILPSNPNMTLASETLRNAFNKAVLLSSTGKDKVLAMEVAMETTYRALPKNLHGLLSRSVVAYLVQKYTMQMHHYSIKGLGSDPMLAEGNASNETGATLQTLAPEVLGALFESHQGRHGLTLRDAAALAVMLNQLVVDHAVEVMDQAFENLALLGMLPEDEEVSIETLVKLVWAWEWLDKHDCKTEWDLFNSHMHEPTGQMYMYGMYGKLAVTLARTKFYLERDHRNPFKSETLSVAEVVQLAQQVTERMGEWQDDDCKAMKKKIIGLDPEGDGRVPHDVLYDHLMDTDETGEQIFRFAQLAEDEDYLRTIGALDESIPEHPQVLISNYILGPANCYLSTALHTFCCLNECDAVLGQIERAVKGSSARPAVLEPLLGNLTTPSMDEPQAFSEVLRGKLSAIAAQNHGRVPLHGRLFMQWLHFAFPHECPYPHVTQKDEAGNVLMTSYFQGTAGNTVGWTDDEMLSLGNLEPQWALLGDSNIFSAVFMMFALGALSNQVFVIVRAQTRNLQNDIGMDLEKAV